MSLRSRTKKFIRNNEGLVRFEEGRIRHAVVVLRVMIQFIPTEIPAPTELVVADQTLVANAVEWRVRRCDANYRVRAPLPRTPVEFPYVHAFRVSHFPSYAVRALGDGVSVKRQLVVLLEEQQNREKFQFKYIYIIRTNIYN